MTGDEHGPGDHNQDNGCMLKLVCIPGSVHALSHEAEHRSKAAANLRAVAVDLLGSPAQLGSHLGSREEKLQPDPLYTI